VEEIRSVSLFGLSFVSVYFKDDVDIYFARRLVGEKLLEAKDAHAGGLWRAGAGAELFGLGQVFWYTVESADQKLSAMDLRTLQDWNVRLMLRTAAGVDDVTSWGGDEKQFQVLIQPHKADQVRADLQSGDGGAGRQQPPGRRAVREPRPRAVPGARTWTGRQHHATSATSSITRAKACRSTFATWPRSRKRPACASAR
jgi:hypothetical protein